MTDFIGQVLNSRFRVEGILGKGNMGVVYSARDEVLERLVAIKVLRAELTSDPRFVTRFIREAKIIAQLSSNPHIITIYELGQTEQNQPFLVTEYLTGKTLRAFLDDYQPFSRTWIYEVGIQIALALSDVHSRGVIHRDLKPENIFMLKSSVFPWWTKVLDFGLSRTDRGLVAAATVTLPGTIQGTPRYLAPETVSGEEPMPASDIYSFGLVLYELATGKSPYTAERPIEYLRAHVLQTPTPFPAGDYSFPDAFHQLVYAMLSKEPSQRPNADQCLRQLAQINEDYEKGKR